MGGLANRYKSGFERRCLPARQTSSFGRHRRWWEGRRFMTWQTAQMSKPCQPSDASPPCDVGTNMDWFPATDPNSRSLCCADSARGISERPSDLVNAARTIWNISDQPPRFVDGFTHHLPHSFHVHRPQNDLVDTLLPTRIYTRASSHASLFLAVIIHIIVHDVD
jgi:hypothetical protein